MTTTKKITESSGYEQYSPLTHYNLSSVNKDIDLDPEQSAEKIQQLLDTMDVSEIENMDTVSSDELNKDNEYAKALADLDPELQDKLVKASVKKAEEVEKLSKKYESIVKDLCFGKMSLENAVSFLLK